MNRQPPVNPLGPIFLAVVAVLIFGAIYWAFGIGKDALIFAVSLLGVLAMPVVVIFGVTGIVLGIRRLLRCGRP
jgi:hypothetical protein